MHVLVLVRRAMLPGLLVLVALGLAACGPAAPATAPTAESQLSVQSVSPTPATAGTATALPGPTQPLTPTATVAAPLGPQLIFLDAPPAGTLVGSPVQLTGRTQRMPAGGQLGYQVLNSASQVIGIGTVPVSVDAGGGAFNAPLTFTLPQGGGTVTARLFENNPDGSQAAISSLDLFVQSQVQAITIDTPPAGTQVGSPMTLTGRVARMPSQGLLSYLVTNSSQQQIGAGTFAISGDPGRPASFVGSLEFALPFDGDTITARIYDQDQANGASVSLVVAPVPQSIAIDTPPEGALVGSPMTITGRTVRFPANGQLNYRITNAGGGQIGAGSFPVGANSTPGAQFNAQVAFSVPYEGGAILLTIADPTTPAGEVAASINLDVRPQYQRIDIDTPPAGAQVGSPMTITGHTNWFPSNGQLSYRVLDAGNAIIGSGAVAVAGAPGTRGSFNAQITFIEPAAGGNIRVELADPSNGGNFTTAILLNVAPPPPPQIAIDTPPPGTQVGSPMTITGRASYIPNGQLSYRVRDAAGKQIGQGNVPFAPNGRQAAFNASLTFSEPAAGGNITVEIIGPNPASSTPISVSITLYVAPKR